MITDVAVDPAGNLWAANNWNAVEPVVAEDPIRPTGCGSTQLALRCAKSSKREPASSMRKPIIPNECVFSFVQTVCLCQPYLRDKAKTDSRRR